MKSLKFSVTNTGLIKSIILLRSLHVDTCSVLSAVFCFFILIHCCSKCYFSYICLNLAAPNTPNIYFAYCTYLINNNDCPFMFNTCSTMSILLLWSKSIFVAKMMPVYFICFNEMWMCKLDAILNKYILL